MRVLVALVLVLGLSACGHDVDLVGTWRLTHVVVEGDVVAVPAARTSPYLTIGAASASAVDGCNQRPMGVEIDGSHLQLTERGPAEQFAPCVVDDPIIRRFATLLTQVESAERDGHHLVLTCEGVRFEFVLTGGIPY